jgi:hypothetical protein
MVLFFLYDIEKSNVNARMPEKSWYGIGIGISSGSQLSAFRHQDLVRYSGYSWSRISPALPRHDKK